MSDDEGRTPATPHRREQALQQGLAPATPDAALVVVALCSVVLLGRLPETLERTFSAAARDLWSPASFGVLTSGDLGLATLPAMDPTGCWGILLLAAGAVLLAGLLQKGFRFQPGRVVPDPARVTPRWPMEGTAAAVEPLVRGLVRLGLLAWIGLGAVWAVLPSGPLGPLADDLVPRLSERAPRLLAQFALLAALAALADYAWRRFRFERSIMMTPEEVRQEQRMLDGDPRVRSEIESRMRRPAEARAGRGAGAVRKVLLIDGSRALVAGIDVDPRATPIVLGFGEGRQATELVASARLLAVETIQVEGLTGVEALRVGSTVPPALFAPLAQAHARLFAPGPAAAGGGER